MIDPDGYRPNVGIIIYRESDTRLFWGRRVRKNGWQFPQGGMNTDETPEEAMYRELEEETGLQPEHVELVAATPGWLRYKLPQRYLRRHSKPLCIGQKQVWFLLKLVVEEQNLQLDCHETPEFDSAMRPRNSTVSAGWITGIPLRMLFHLNGMFTGAL